MTRGTGISAWVWAILPAVLLAGGAGAIGLARSVDDVSDTAVDTAAGEFIALYCAACHHPEDPAGGLDLEGMAAQPLGDHRGGWERVVRKLQTRQMPPLNEVRPSARSYEAITSHLVGALDQAARETPQPGRTDTFRRLNRTEYHNAVRDLLGVEIDATSLLPDDPSSQGFDNITLGDLSPTLLDRYVTAAQAISRLAVGRPGRSPGGETYRLAPDLTQEEHVGGLPLGTRGGALWRHTFPTDGVYEVQVRLSRDRNEHLEGLREPHEMVILVDGAQLAEFTIEPPRNETEHQTADAQLRARIRVTGGVHALGVTFVAQSSSLIETERQPYQAHYNMHRHPRLGPAVYQVSITGPFQPPRVSDTPSRRRLFVCEPAGSGDDERETCAREILRTLMRRAYRRPVAEADLATPLRLFRQACATEGFDAGIELALSSVLVSPHFLFRIEADRPGLEPGAAYRITARELASRLSFFLWSSIPDDELLDLAEAGTLSRPDILEAQVRRLLADVRSESLVTNFADQWLHLRNLDSITPDLRLFPDFDDNLRQSFRAETQALFQCVLREDRSVLDLIRADFTYLDERLARHYGIDHVRGSRLRRVSLAGTEHRGGLLRQGGILTVTSYATRTSPVIRGKWILENLFGTPPPPPPANVPALSENTVLSTLSVRERLTQHRANPACASCHDLIDPLGFALENYDALGRWRESEEGQPIDATGGLPWSTAFDGVDGLEQAILDRPELFVGTLAEKLLTFALGRGLAPEDGPAIREVVHQAEEADYRLSAIVIAIVQSVPFQMRSNAP